MHQSVKTLVLVSCFFVSVIAGCDEKAAPAKPAGQPTGDATGSSLPNDVPEPKPDDYKATLLLNDAYAALERGDAKTVEAKLGEVEALKEVSPGIPVQVAEVRAKLVAPPATKPAGS